MMKNEATETKVSWEQVKKNLSLLNKHPLVTDDAVRETFISWIDGRSIGAFQTERLGMLNMQIREFFTELAFLGRANILTESFEILAKKVHKNDLDQARHFLFQMFLDKGMRPDDNLTEQEHAARFWSVIEAFGMSKAIKNPQHPQAKKYIEAAILSHMSEKQFSVILDDLLALPLSQKIMRNPQFFGRCLLFATNKNYNRRNPIFYKKIGTECSPLRLAEQALQIPREEFLEIFQLRSSSDQQKILNRCLTYKTEIKELKDIEFKNNLLSDLQNLIDQKPKSVKRHM